MEVGKYTRRKINFAEFEVKRFPLVLYDADIYGLSSCGYCLLGLITGHDPYKIKKLNKQRNSCEDKFIINYLKKNNFKIAALTQCNMSNTLSNLIDEKIKPYHVLITSQLLKRNECSWFCHYFGYNFHNFTINKTRILDFVNYPLISAYLIKHKSWS